MNHQDGMRDRDRIAAEKRRIREEILRHRARLPADAHRDASERIRLRTLAVPEVQHAASVFVFVSFDTEVDTHPLVTTLLRDGRRVAVPRIVDRTTIRATPVNTWDDLVPGRWGILAPRRRDVAQGPFDVAIMPGVAFTEQGARLGHGRGYYDRWLERNTVSRRIALAFECQIVPDLPLEPHDRPVDAIVTENRVITINGEP